MIATFTRLLGDSSSLAAQIWEGRMNGAEARDACLRNVRLGVMFLGCKYYEFCFNVRNFYLDDT
jgi:hypothetical protein